VIIQLKMSRDLPRVSGAKTQPVVASPAIGTSDVEHK